MLIHAGLNLASYNEETAAWIARRYRIHVPNGVDTGGIVGAVDVVDCVEQHRSRWFEPGAFGWVLANPRRLAFRECKGAVGLFRPEFGGDEGS